MASLFFLELAEFGAKAAKAVMVYDQGNWQANRALWENVQKVSLLPDL